jgi:hypothetical protein
MADLSAKSLLQDDDVKRMQVPHFTDHLGEVTDCKSQQQFLDLLEGAFVAAQSRKDIETLHENNSWALSNMRQKDADGTMLSMPIDDVYAMALLRTAPKSEPVNPDWQTWAADLYKSLGDAASYGQANDLWLDQKDAITQLRKDDPKFYAIVEGQFKAIRAKKPKDSV